MSADGFALLDDVMYALGMHYAETIIAIVRWTYHREAKRFQMWLDPRGQHSKN